MSIGATFCAMPVRFRPVPNEIIVGKLRCCFARCSKIRNGSTHILLRVLAVNVTRSDDLGRVTSVKFGIRSPSSAAPGWRWTKIVAATDDSYPPEEDWGDAAGGVPDAQPQTSD